MANATFCLCSQVAQGIFVMCVREKMTATTMGGKRERRTEEDRERTRKEKNRWTDHWNYQPFS